MTEYLGHRSKNAWNVALWIGNDEGLYCLALGCLKGINKNKRGYAWASRKFLACVGDGARTPDGARYNFTCVKEALRGLE
jgi:hypothetical protein